MKAEIIASGTELLLGEIVDSNTSFIARQLATLGIDLYYVSIVGDNYERFLGVLMQAWQRSDIIITTGGLGPTQGDITRNVIAALLGESPRVDDTLKQHLTRYFSRLGIEMPESNLKQATLIPSAAAMPNPLGTAPGWWVEKEGRTIIALPGPPVEMLPMWQSEVARRLSQKSSAIILSRVLKVSGLSEAKVDELLSPLLSSTNPTVALYAKPDGIHVRITAKAAQKELASEKTSRFEADIRSILGEHVWGTDDETMEQAVSQLLINKRLTLAIAESFTGGLLSCMLSGVSNSPVFLKGSLIANTDDAKTFLGLDVKLVTSKNGAEICAQMAALARHKFAADIGIAIDGHAEPTSDIAAGKMFIAIDNGQSGRKTVQSYSFRLNQMTRRATQNALFNLRAFLLTL